MCIWGTNSEGGELWQSDNRGNDKTARSSPTIDSWMSKTLMIVIDLLTFCRRSSKKDIVSKWCVAIK